MNEMQIRQARAQDVVRIKDLLTAESLPTEGVDKHVTHFLVAEQSGEIVGSIGLEVYDQTALLRSAVVEKSVQGKGIGSLLYNAVLKRARGLGVSRLLLLTNTAETYFHRKGFRKIEQKSVAGPVTSSAEFSGACPSHAVCMELLL
jgi:amino-acid N-acetyltransferase